MSLPKFFVAPKNGQRGVKKCKKNIFQKVYSKDGKNKFWDVWDQNCKKSFFWDICGQGGGMIVPRSPPKVRAVFNQNLS